jgi:hypothetical protein
MFPIKNGLKQGDVLTLLFCNFALQCAIRRVKVNQDGLKLNGTHQLLVYADDVSIMEGKVHTIKKNTEALVVASRGTGLEVNADESKYMVMSRDQNAGRSHNMKTDNSSSERGEEFRYLGITLTYKNSFREEIKSRSKSGNACYHPVQNLLSSSLLSQNMKIKDIQGYNFVCCFV